MGRAHAARHQQTPLPSPRQTPPRTALRCVRCQKEKKACLLYRTGPVWSSPVRCGMGCATLRPCSDRRRTATMSSILIQDNLTTFLADALLVDQSLSYRITTARATVSSSKPPAIKSRIGGRAPYFQNDHLSRYAALPHRNLLDGHERPAWVDFSLLGLAGVHGMCWSVPLRRDAPRLEMMHSCRRKSTDYRALTPSHALRDPSVLPDSNRPSPLPCFFPIVSIFFLAHRSL